MMNESIADIKSHIRKHHHTLRRSLLGDEWKKLSTQIIDRLMDSNDFNSASAIHTYVSMKSNREVFTLDLISACLKMNKQVLLPRMSSDGELTHHKITSLDSLSKNKWGVHEPSDESETKLPDNLLVIVPMVAADFKRNRLGYGKGYYDRFLSQINTTKIGLCFNMNLSWTPLPVESFDVSMDKVITNQFII